MIASNPQKLVERPRTGLPSQLSEGTATADDLNWTSSLQNCQIINFYCVSHPVVALYSSSTRKLTELGTECFLMKK